MNKQNFKEFVEENKKEIAIAVGGIILGACGAITITKYLSRKDVGKLLTDNLKTYGNGLSERMLEMSSKSNYAFSIMGPDKFENLGDIITSLETNYDVSKVDVVDGVILFVKTE